MHYLNKKLLSCRAGVGFRLFSIHCMIIILLLKILLAIENAYSQKV